MDPLSEIFGVLKPQNCVSAGFEAGGDWALNFQAYPGIKINAVVAGECRLSIPGVTNDLAIEAGDCFVLPRGLPFRLASDLEIDGVDAATVFSPVSRGGIAIHQDGGDFLLVGSRFDFAGDPADMLLDMLPPLIHIDGKREHEWLISSLARLRYELRSPRPGAGMVTQNLAYLMFIEALRHVLKANTEDRKGWFFALADKQMNEAISQIHAEPAHRWTVRELAACAGMSRTAFAVSFRQTVGMTPMAYLARWRMICAGERLKHSNDHVAVVARSLGYESESAFGAAFKRVMGASPRAFCGRKIV